MPLVGTAANADGAFLVASELEHLMGLLVPGLEGEASARLTRYSMRILGSRLGGTLAGEAQTAEVARRRLVQSGRPADALALTEALNQLRGAGHGLRHLPAALQLLCALMQSQSPPATMSACAGAALLSRAAPQARPLPAQPLASVAAPEPDAPPDAPPDAAKPARAKAPSAPNGKAAAGTDEASEKALVRDVLFVLQNIDGNLLKWDAARDAFVPPPGMPLPRSCRQLVGRLCELGWLFRQIDGYVKAQAAPGGGRGLVVQAFGHALQAELGEWYQLLAVLDAQRQSELSLVQLLVWSHEPMQRMLTMAQLVRASGSLKGGALSVAIHRHERHGDPDTATYVRHLLRQSLAPLFEMLRSWVLHGELHGRGADTAPRAGLNDPHAEFFVETRAVPLQQLWHGRYVLVEAMLPCFVSRALGEQVLLVGKAINFIRLSCADAQWSLLGAARGEGGADEGGAGAGWLGELEYGQEEQLEAFVRQAAARANARLLELLLGRYRLRQHCANIKQYLLLGKGDFVQYLMEHLAPQLSRPSSQLHRHQLLSLLESAVRSGSSSSSPAEGGGDDHDFLLKHLDVALAKDPQMAGWDAFALDYSVSTPVSEVLSAEAMAQYRSVFTFLWKLKRVEHSLTSTWRKHGTAAHVLRMLRGERGMHGCHLLRNEMIHFVYNLQYYLMFEVLECSWQTLLARLEAAADFDELLAAHRAFLASIVQKALLGPADEAIYEALKGLFEAILRFSKAQDVLYLNLLEQQAAARHRSAAVQANVAAGRWGDHGLGRADAPPSLDAHFQQQLERHAAQYRKQFAQFFRQVSQHASLDLAFLSFRLDFNLFYEAELKPPDEAQLSEGATPQPSPPTDRPVHWEAHQPGGPAAPVAWAP